MAGIPFSLRLDEKTRRRLDDEARRLDRPASQVASRAIARFLDAQDACRRAIDEAVEEAVAGVFISSDAMAAKMEARGAERETPPPDVGLRHAPA